eukprot:gene6591-3245_t
MEEGMGETACENDSAISSAYPNETLLPKWFTARRLLILFCFVNVFVYLDRGLIASNGVNGSPPSEKNPEGTGIQGAFKLTYFEDGLLPGAFMVGLLISSPVFAEACKTVSAFRLLAVGMGIWSLACIGCGAAPNFVVLMICRALVGVGEASFVALAVPFIGAANGFPLSSLQPQHSQLIFSRLFTTMFTTMVTTIVTTMFTTFFRFPFVWRHCQ